jgi:Tetratricopeptide repeat
LASITEAVDIRRELAGANPAAYLPDLATSLNNLSVQQAETGDRQAALVSITEAVDIRRELAGANPGAYLPDLATSLNNLSLRQAETGDRQAALASITEAVEHYRELAGVNPAAYLPDLAKSLNNLANQHADDTATARAAWSDAVEFMSSIGARAELRTAWARRLLDTGDSTSAARELRAAAGELDTTTPSDLARPELIVQVRARHAVRELAAQLDNIDGLPVWATAALPEPHVELLNLIASADWPAAEDAVRNTDDLLSPGMDDSLAVVDALYPGHPAPGQIRALREEIRRLGLDEALGRRRAAHARAALLAAWIGTRTWDESFTFLREHIDELTAAEILDQLAASDQPVAQQHRAILDLVRTDRLDDVRALVTEPGAAEDAALDAIQAGDVHRLAAIATASEALPRRPVTHRLVTAIFTALDGNVADAAATITEFARSSTDIERRALAIRLRSLLRHQPRLAALAPTIEALAAPPDT